MGTVAADVLDLIRRYLDDLRAAGVEPARVILFGSQARGTAGPLSDIDLLVISPSFATIPPAERPWLLARANRLRAPIQVLCATPEAVEQAGPASFLREVLREGIAVA